MLKKLLTVLTLTFAVGASANAQYLSGERLLGAITSTDKDKMLMGMSYIVGVQDAKFSEKLICAPAESTAAQATRIVQKMLEELPDLLHKNAGGLVSEILKNVWPCPQKK